MRRDGDDLSGLRKDELSVAALAGSRFDEPGRLQPANQLTPRHLLSVTERLVYYGPDVRV
jgi:hypothetical protein